MVLGLVATSAVTAQQVVNVLSVRNTEAAPGQLAVMVPVDLSNEGSLTVLAFTLTWETSLCTVLVNPAAMAVTAAGRARFLLEPTPGCATGSMRVAFNSGQGDVVIPPPTPGGNLKGAALLERAPCCRLT